MLDFYDLIHEDPDYLETILNEIGVEETEKLKLLEATESKYPLPFTRVIHLVFYMEDKCKLLLDAARGTVRFDDAKECQDFYLKTLEDADLPIAWKKEALLSYTAKINVESKREKEKLFERVHKICPKDKNKL